ncbi:MAG: hypothetical protein HY904_00365 [Deltaproteobacteria bacterium]|nr:hypothetical protein [Deltaproteobacteria bacterium]
MSAQPAHWCRRLRWKTYSVDQEDPARVGQVFAEGATLFTCLATTHPVGPDDGAVAPECCAPDRSCYQPHPRLACV